MTTIRYCLISFFLLSSVVACGPREQASDATDSADDERIDLIVRGDHIVTMDPAATILQNGAVAIDEGLIIAIGSVADIEAEYTAVETLDGNNRVVNTKASLLKKRATYSAENLNRALLADT